MQCGNASTQGHGVQQTRQRNQKHKAGTRLQSMQAYEMIQGSKAQFNEQEHEHKNAYATSSQRTQQTTQETGTYVSASRHRKQTSSGLGSQGQGTRVNKWQGHKLTAPRGEGKTWCKQQGTPSKNIHGSVNRQGSKAQLKDREQHLRLKTVHQHKATNEYNSIKAAVHGYIYMVVCMYIYICTHLYTYIYAYTNTYIYLHICSYTSCLRKDFREKITIIKRFISKYIHKPLCIYIYGVKYISEICAEKINKFAESYMAENSKIPSIASRKSAEDWSKNIHELWTVYTWKYI